MIDVSKAKYELSPVEKYAVRWFDKHGFSVTLDKQFLSKTRFIITKDSITDIFELPGECNAKSYMEQYEKTWNTLCKIQRLRQQA